MKLIRLFILLVSLIFISGLSHRVHASHSVGADLTYVCVGNNQYVFTFKFYRDCSGISAPTSANVVYSSISCSQNFTVNLPLISSQEVSALCPTATSTCQGGSQPGIEEYIYMDTVLIPAQCTDWLFSMSHCCRNPLITNLTSPSSQNIYVESTLDNTGGLCNSSPVFSSLAAPYLCNGMLTNYNFLAFDPDGDSLVFTLINPLTTGGAAIGYNAGFSPTLPLNTTTGSILFNSTNGQMSFTPNGIQVGVVTVLVEEYRNGVLIGSIMRDIQMIVLNCGSSSSPEMASPGMNNVTNATVIDSISVNMCIGAAFQFTAVFFDNDVANTLSLTTNLATAFPSALITTTGTNPITMQFSWTPTIADVGLNSLVVTVADDGCPVTSIQAFAFTLDVELGTYAGPDINLCLGDTTQLNATGGFGFQWSPSTGLSNDTIANPLAFPTVTTTYVLISSFIAGNCDTIDTMTITVVPSFSLTVSQDTTICLNGSTQLSSSVSPAGSYTYSWTPTSTLNFDSIPNPLASPLTSTTYQLSATSTAQCIKTESVNVTVNTTPLSANPSVDDSYLCNGDTTMLHANVGLLSCTDYTYSSIPFGPISGSGTSISLADDAVSAALPIGFDFTFYCNSYNQFYIGSNGFMTFSFNSGSSGCCSGQVLPNAVIPNNLIAFAWEDLSPQLGTVEYFTSGSAPNRALVMNFINVPHYGSNNMVTSQVVLYEATSIVEIHTTEMASDGGSHTMGIENSNGTIAETVPGRNSTNWSATNDGVRFTPLNQPYTVTWMDPDSVVIGTTQDIQIIATTTGTYSVIVSNGACTDLKLVDVIVNNLDIGFDTILLCFGDSFQTNPVFGPIGSGIPPSCGVSSGCSGTGGTSSIMVGNGTSVNGSTTYPAPFGNWFKNAKHQILYTATDLLSAGVTPGTITEIGFPVTTISGTNLYKAFSIKLGCTGLTSLSTWQTGLTQVYTPTNVTINIGMNTLVLDAPYDWDGVSNIIMELCFDNLSDPSYTNNSATPFTITGYTSVIYYRSDGTAACPWTGTATSSNNRPNTNFTVCTEAFNPTFSWMPSAGVSNDSIVNPVLSPSSSTLYTLSFDDGLCIITDSIYIASTLTLGLSGTSQSAGCGLSDGSATVNNGGGVAPYTYLWNDGSNQTNSIATGLGVGSYTVVITDDNGCTDSIIVSVSESGGPTLSTSQTNPLCFGSGTGIATVIASAGAPPYTYLWDDNGAQTTASATGLSAGIYIVLVTGNNCVSSISVTITEPTQMWSTNISTDPVCFGDCNGTIQVSVNGGTNPISYLWDDPAAQTTAAATGLCDGSYNVIYTDANGCFDLINVTLTEPVIMVSSITGSISNPCFGSCLAWASVGLTSGGVSPFSYLWDDPAAQTDSVATWLCPGSYLGTVVDVNGCSSGASAVVITGAPPTVLTLSSISATCGANDGSAIVVATGGTPPHLNFVWNTTPTQNNDTASSLGFGVYTVTVYDSNWCSTTGSIVVNNIGAATLSASIDSIVSCYSMSDGVATVTATGGLPPLTYQWNDFNSQTTATATGLSGGTYTVTVLDSNGCAASILVTIDEPGWLGTTVQITDVTCNSFCDGSALANTWGGTLPYTYLWNDPASQTSENAINLCAGVYVYSIEDSNGCSTAISLMVNEPSLIQTSITSINETCTAGNGSGTFVVTGGVTPYQYLWDDPAAQTDSMATGLSAGAYAVIVTDDNGCTANDSIVLTNTDVSVDNINTVAATCGLCDGSATVTVSGISNPLTYQWNDPAAQTGFTALNLCPGMYSFTVTDGNGCTASDSVTVLNIEVSLGNLTGVDPTCGGCDGSASVSASGGTIPYTYTWDDVFFQTTATANNLCQGTYSVTVTDGLGCTKTSSITLTQPAGFTLSSIIEEPSCAGDCDGTATVLTSGNPQPLNFLWNDPGAQTTPIATGLCAGTYMITVTNFSGCSVCNTVILAEPDALVATITSSPATTGNNDGTATVEVSLPVNPLTYLWSDSLAQTTQIATGLPAGTYTVKVTDGNGCSITGAVAVAEIISVWDLEIGVRFEIYPNPTTGMVVFDLELLEVGDITIQIIDAMGKVVYETSESVIHLLKQETDLSDLSDGLYFVRLATDKGTVRRGIVIAK